jgi:colicin import membrane protein
MKKLLFAAMMLMPLAAMAQDNTWEQTEKKTTEDTRYLAGAVPEVDGRVVFETTIQAPGKSAKQIFTLLRDDMQKMTKEPNQIEQSRVSLADAATGELVGQFQEWLVFKNKPLQLDRTRLLYTLTANCRDGEATVKMMRINYFYDEERTPTTYKAEEWITDKYGLNKKKTKLARVSGKFRRKTIDRKDYLFEKLQEFLNNK